jgi:hypothetical protein
MQEYVDIEGSGELNTIITSVVADCNSGTVNGANNAELRFLTVASMGGSNCHAAIYNDSASPRLTHVTATASGGDSTSGVYNSSSSPTIKQSTLSGSTNSLFQDVGTTKVADTQLVGPVSKDSGALHCFGNYNENMAAVSCP